MLIVHSSHLTGFSTEKIEFSFYQNTKKIKTCTFRVPANFFASNDAIAAAAIAIRPVPCSEIQFNFPVSHQAKIIAARDYKIGITSETRAENDMASRHANYLNFSGGIDSLSAYYLLGDAVQNISIDFGGYFQREADWFREWPTYCIETDFREKPFNEALDWRFMGACTMLYADYLHIETVYWGTVLEASTYWFSSDRKADADSTNATHAFAIAGLKMAQTVTPLSEYGTMKVALCLGDSIVQDSIISCAAPYSEKALRKLLLAEISRGNKIDKKFWERNKCEKKYRFGTSFALDVLTIYFISVVGADPVRSFMTDITDRDLQDVQKLDMRFFEKYNLANLQSIPKGVRSQIVAGYENSGIAAYSDDDFTALNACRKYLKNIHHFI